MSFDDEISRRYPHILFRKHWSLDERAVYLLGECDAIVEAISLMPLQPEYRKQLLRVSLIKGAQATTAIEGNSLTEAEIQRIADGASLAPSKKYQEQEVRNVLDAMNHLLQAVAVDGSVPLITTDLVRQFHSAVGRDLGEQFDAIPGRFRTDERVVGPYKCPGAQDVPELINRLCEWLPRGFGFASGRQTFAEAVVQAIVTHVYLEWIHPFGDGNGRTGRLLEFYILLRAGNPDIASHILSNFYNETRPEYYRHLHRANKERDLTAFISYALQGYYDGLRECLSTIQNSMFEVAWKYLVHGRFAEHRHRKRTVLKRRRDLMLSLRPTENGLSVSEIAVLTPELARLYAGLSTRTLLRDLDALKQMELVIELHGRFKPNLGLLGTHVARRRVRPAA